MKCTKIFCKTRKQRRMKFLFVFAKELMYLFVKSKLKLFTFLTKPRTSRCFILILSCNTLTINFSKGV